MSSLQVAVKCGQETIPQLIPASPPVQHIVSMIQSYLLVSELHTLQVSLQ